MTATPPNNPSPPASSVDPFIDEVRNLKRAASERFGHDLARIAEHLRQIERAQTSPPIQPPKTDHAGRVA